MQRITRRGLGRVLAGVAGLVGARRAAQAPPTPDAPAPLSQIGRDTGAGLLWGNTSGLEGSGDLNAVARYDPVAAQWVNASKASEPASDDHAALYLVDNGSGETVLKVRFADGTTKVLGV
jgi:hypothetical protein